jgi:hypothetical protein
MNYKLKITLFTLFISIFSFTQAKDEKCELINKENKYLKKILSINSPILELTHDNTQIKITKIQGLLDNNEIHFTLLLESKDQNKEIELSDIEIIDIEGNDYKVNHFKTGDLYPKLSLNVPLKRVFVFSEVINKPQIIKLLRFKLKSTRDFFDSKSSLFEFKDLNTN